MQFNTPTWSLMSPREWQKRAFIAACAYFLTGNSGVIRAIMGAGKSVLIAELAATAVHDWKNPVVITTPSEMLVKQLTKTIRGRCRGSKTVGSFYNEAKESETDVIVACNKSLLKLADRFSQSGRNASLWIADEMHKTECETIKNAFGRLAPHRSIGFTATPFRSSESQTISLFNDLIFDYGVSEALKDGVIVKPEFISWTGDPKATIDEACLEMIKPMQGPGLVNASSVKDAESFAAKLNDIGFSTVCVHSKLREDQNEATMERLRAGQIRCVSYVDMLCEGVDYPWLRWGCLRRDVGSRVRFHQELGRFVRADKDKTHAVILDPNDLFGIHRQSIEACLGQEPSDEELVEEVLDLPLQQRIDFAEKEENFATALMYFEAELRRLIVACDADGICPDRTIVKRSEREKSISALQKRMVAKLMDDKRFIPAQWHPFFELVSNQIGKMKFGPASDLCCILNSVREYKRFPPISTEGRISAGMGEKSEVAPWRPVHSAKKWEQLTLEFN